MKKLLPLVIVCFVLSGCETLQGIIEFTEGLVVSEKDGEIIVGRVCKPADDGGKDCVTTLPSGRKIAKHYKPGEKLPAIETE